MKNKLWLFAVLLTVSVNTFAQDLSALKIGAEKLYTATTTLDYDAILECTYPKVFEITPKAELKEVIISTFNGTEEMKIKLIPVAPEFTFGKIKKIKNQSFCLIDHNLTMQFIITEKVEDSEELIQVFKESLDAKSVTYDKETNTYTINLRPTMIAVYDDLTNKEWKFLNKDKKNVLFDQLFNADVKKELGL